MNARIGIPTISGDKSCPTCLIKEERMGKEEDVTENGGVHAHVEGRYDLIPPEALRTIAAVMEEGVRNGREDGNWRMIPCHIHINHALSHLVAVMMGEVNEDHLGHALTRLAFAVAVRKEKF